MKWAVQATVAAVAGLMLAGSVSIHPSQSSQSLSQTERFIVDVDHAIDDVFALALALRSPGIEVVGITITPHPEAAQQVRFVARLLRELGKESIPISVGTSLLTNSCRCGHWDTISHTLGVDYPAPLTESAHEFMVRQAHANPGNVSLLTLGLLTNLADALRDDPSIAEKISRVVMLGGTGSQVGNDCYEYNVSTDIAAAQRVLSSGIPVLMVGVDVTGRVNLSADDIRQALAEPDRFSQVMRIYWEASGGNGFCPHDLLAVLAAVNEEAFSWAVGSTTLVPDGCLSFARSQEGTVGLATRVDAGEFRQFVIDHLTGIPSSSGSRRLTDSALTPPQVVANGEARKKVIVDVHYVVDDLFALAVALNSPELEVIGVTEVQRTELEREVRVVARLLREAGRADIPLLTNKPRGPYCKGCCPWTVKTVTLGVDDPAPQVESAAEFIVRTVNAAPGEITIIMVGPLTSLGEALRLDPSIAQKIRELVMLGGSIATDYDLADKPAKEANVSMDIPAAKAVFASGLPILMVGLDASAMLRVDQELLDRIENTLPVNGFLREWCRRGEFATFVPFDVMAVAMAVDRSFCEVQRGHIEIADDGYTRLVPGLADNAEYCLNPNVDAFNDFIQTRLGIDDSAIAQR